MLSKFVEVGSKIELRPVERGLGQKSGDAQKTYISRIHAILSEDSMEIVMPMEKTKLILLPVDGEFEMVIYGASGLYQCMVRIADRYKSNNVYILLVEMISNLRKYQRREYYRFSCVLEMCSRNLEEEELQAIEGKKASMLQPGLPLKRSVILDISGGGLRFICDQRYEPDSLIYCSYSLLRGEERKEYEVIGRVLAAKELENRPGTYEHRVQYYNMDANTREEIIKFIFEEERKNRNAKGRE